MAVSYYLNSIIRFINASAKHESHCKVELRADLVEYINEINYEKAKEFLEKKFIKVG